MATVTVDQEKLPYPKSFQLLQGDTLWWPVRIKIKAEAATAYSDLNLTGCTLNLSVKKGSTTVINGTAQAVDTASEGKFTLQIAAATTATWAGDYSYELSITFPNSHTNYPSGAVRTYFAGRINVRADL